MTVELKPYGAGCVCTLWLLMQPGMISRLVGMGIWECFPQFQMPEAFKSDVYFLGIFLSTFFIYFSGPPHSFIQCYSGKKWRQLSLSWLLGQDAFGELEEQRFLLQFLHSYEEPLLEHLAHPRANTFTELIPPVIIYCLHVCRQSQVDHFSWIEIWTFSLFWELGIYSLQRNADDCVVWECSPSCYT